MSYNSHFYDFELLKESWVVLDVVLDSSEYYDYELGENTMDYIYKEIFVIVGNYLITEDDYIFTTHNNYNILYH